MGLLINTDLNSHIFPEVRNEITRGNDELTQTAIKKAEAEARSYLNRYDVATMFVTGFADEFLRSLCKDIACWHLLKLCNPNVNMELFRMAYEDAIKYLDKVSKGIVDPEWPLRADDPDTSNDESGHIYFASEMKRTNHY